VTVNGSGTIGSVGLSLVGGIYSTVSGTYLALNPANAGYLNINGTSYIQWNSTVLQPINSGAVSLGGSGNVWANLWVNAIQPAAFPTNTASTFTLTGNLILKSNTCPLGVTGATVFWNSNNIATFLIRNGTTNFGW
jgi:hypothetical protein